MDHLYIQNVTGFLSGIGMVLGVLSLKTGVDAPLGCILIILSAVAMTVALMVRHQVQEKYK